MALFSRFNTRYTYLTDLFTTALVPDDVFSFYRVSPPGSEIKYDNHIIEFSDLATSVIALMPPAWDLLGNTGTIDGVNFIGTTDNIPLTFKVNSIQSGRIDHLLFNTFLGYQAGVATTGASNTGVGHDALYFNISGDYNTATGLNALYVNSIGTQNTANGVYALFYNTIGGYNTAQGSHALFSNKTGSEAVAIGTSAMKFTNDTLISFINKNVAVGFESLHGSFVASDNIGNGNTAIGYKSSKENIAGNDNTSVGNSALTANTYASQNVAVGTEALFTQSFANANVVWPTDNVAIGYQTLYNNQPATVTVIGGPGTANTAVGSLALHTNIIGTVNTAIGFRALISNTGNANTAVGAGALQSNISGSTNIAIGFNAGESNVGGNFNIFIGAGIVLMPGIVNGNANTIIGSNISGLAPNLSNNIILADGQGVIRQQFSNTGALSLTGPLTSTITLSVLDQSLELTVNGVTYYIPASLVNS